MIHNPNCDGDHCRKENAEVRVLPMGGDSNGILCQACYEHEIGYRLVRNQDLCVESRFDIPSWKSLKIYGDEL